MIGKLLNGLMSFIISLISTLLSPIDTLISQNMPVLDNALTHINSFFDYIIDIIGYVIDASCLTDVAIGLVVSYYVFSITSTLIAFAIKIGVKWYNALKL